MRYPDLCWPLTPGLVREMSSESARQPFLGHIDDDPEKEEARQFRHVKPSRGNILPYIVVCFATSIFWAGLFYLFHPGNGPSTSPHPPAHAPSAAAMTAAATTTTAGGSLSRHNVTTGARLLTCGEDVAAAKASGCRYDVLLSHWVPGPCYGQGHVDEHLDDGSWAGYADEAMTARLTARETSGRAWYWASARDRASRCAAVWRRQFWALYEERRALDTVVASPRHTYRCAQFLVDAGGRNWTRPTRVEVGFAGCWVREDR